MAILRVPIKNGESYRDCVDRLALAQGYGSQGELFDSLVADTDQATAAFTILADLGLLEAVTERGQKLDIVDGVPSIESPTLNIMTETGAPASTMSPVRNLMLSMVEYFENVKSPITNSDLANFLRAWEIIIRMAYHIPGRIDIKESFRTREKK